MFPRMKSIVRWHLRGKAWWKSGMPQDWNFWECSVDSGFMGGSEGLVPANQEGQPQPPMGSAPSNLKEFSERVLRFCEAMPVLRPRRGGLSVQACARWPGGYGVYRRSFAVRLKLR